MNPLKAFLSTLSSKSNLFFFAQKKVQSIFGKLKMDKKNVQNRKVEMVYRKKTCFVSIIEIYGLVAKKIIIVLLR